MSDKHSCDEDTDADDDDEPVVDDDDEDDDDDGGGWQDVLTDPYKSGAAAKASQRTPCFYN